MEVLKPTGDLNTAVNDTAREVYLAENHHVKGEVLMSR